MSLCRKIILFLLKKIPLELVQIIISYLIEIGSFDIIKESETFHRFAYDKESKIIYFGDNLFLSRIFNKKNKNKHRYYFIQQIYKRGYIKYKSFYQGNQLLEILLNFSLCGKSSGKSSNLLTLGVKKFIRKSREGDYMFNIKHDDNIEQNDHVMLAIDYNDNLIEKNFIDDKSIYILRKLIENKEYFFLLVEKKEDYGEITYFLTDKTTLIEQIYYLYNNF